jgi:hypothetical protein
MMKKDPGDRRNIPRVMAWQRLGRMSSTSRPLIAQSSALFSLSLSQRAVCCKKKRKGKKKVLLVAYWHRICCCASTDRRHGLVTRHA